MSSEATPISPARFALAIADLPLSTLALKTAELRNSIAHLDYSNEELRPFAEGRATISTSSQNATAAGAGEPDQDCIDAIRENEVVIQRMLERIELLKKEVESRGVRWEDLGGEVVKEEAAVDELGRGQDGEEQRGTVEEEGRSQAWRDGTFTTGRIVNGEVRMDDVAGATQSTTNGVNGLVNGTSSGNESRIGGGGTLDDEALRRAVEERIRNLGRDDDAAEQDDGGMHL